MIPPLQYHHESSLYFLLLEIIILWYLGIDLHKAEVFPVWRLSFCRRYVLHILNYAGEKTKNIYGP